MPTTPNGQPTTGDARLAEILGRYRIDSIVGRFIRRAEPELCAAVHRGERVQVAGQGQQTPSSARKPSLREWQGENRGNVRA